MTKRKINSSLAAAAISLCLILLLVFEKTASNEVSAALALSVKRVIPSLFPFMVLSDMIVSMDLLEPLYSLIPTEKLFRLPRCTASVILCGLLCGFPIGAAGAARLYSGGKISRREAEVLCAISSHASPAFLIGVVGGVWGSMKFGVVLYLAEILFCIVSGALISRTVLSKGSCSGRGSSGTAQAPGFPVSLCTAVRTSSITCLAVVGYIVFFRVMGEVLSVIFTYLAPFFAVIFEFSGGAVYGASVGGVVGAFLTGFAVGFSGIAVLMQCCNFTSPHGIKLSCYVITKISEGVVLGMSAALYAWKHPLIPAESTFSLCPAHTEALVPICILAALFLLTSRKSKRNNFTHGS